MYSQRTSVALQIFNERKDQLLASLENVFSKITTDLFIHQMFHDKTSAVFIPDRICEVCRLILKDDRENFISNLLSRVKAFEACFGAERAREIEGIGARLVEISDSPVFDEVSYRKAMRDLKEQLKDATKDMPAEQTVTFEDVSMSQRSVRSPRKLRNYVSDIRKLQTSFLGDLRRARRVLVKAVAAVDAGSNSDERFREMRHEFRRRLEEEKEKREALESEFERKAASYEKEISDLKEQCLSDLEASRSEMDRTEKRIDDIQEELKGRRESKKEEMEAMYKEEIARITAECQEQIRQVRSECRQRLSATWTMQRPPSRDSIGHRSDSDSRSDKWRAGFANTQDLPVITDVQAARSLVQAMQSDMERIKRENGALRRKLQDRTSSRSDSPRSTASTSEDNLEYLHGTAASVDWLSPIEHNKKVVRVRARSEDNNRQTEERDAGLMSYSPSFESRNSMKDFGDSQRSWSIQEVKLRNAEEQNEELIKEIDENDAKIQELTNQLLEKEKQIHQLTQANQKQSKMCDNLQNINKKHDEEIDNLRKEVLKLQQDNLELKSAIDTASPEAPSSDQETQFEKEREKYRNELAKLQKDIADQSMKVTELGRVVDQLNFERDALQRVIQDKDSEMTFVKDRTTKDLQELRATILKTMEENGELNRRCVEAEELNRSLVRQLDGIGSVEEIPRKLWELRQECTDLKAQLDTLQKLCGEDDVADYISNAKRKSAALEGVLASIKAANSNETSQIPTIVRDQLNELSKLQGKPASSGTVQRPQSSAKQADNRAAQRLSAFEEREGRISQLISNYSFDNLPFKISELLKENQVLREKGKQVVIFNDQPPSRRPEPPSGQNLSGSGATADIHRPGSVDRSGREMEQKIRKALGARDSRRPVEDIVSELVKEASRNGGDSNVEQKIRKVLGPRNVQRPIEDIVSDLVREVTNMSGPKEMERKNATAVGTRNTSKPIDEAIPDPRSMNENLLERKIRYALGPKNSGRPVEDIVSDLVKETRNMNGCKEMERRIRNALADRDGPSPVEDIVADLVKENSKMKAGAEIEMKVRNALGPKNTRNPVDEIVSNLVKENSLLNNQLGQIGAELKNPVDIPKAVAALVSRNLELEAQGKLSANVAAGDSAAQVNAMIKECAELKAFQQRMFGIAQTQDKDALLVKAREYFDQAAKIARLFRNSPNPVDDIARMLDQNKSLQAIVNGIMKLLGCSQEEALTHVQDLHTDFNATSNFLMRCIRTISGTDEVKVRCPPSPEVQARILATLQNLLRKLEDAMYIIKEILSKASKTGYMGRDAIAAVEHLEEAAALNARQAYSEQFHKELVDMRAMNAKVHDMAETQRDKFKNMIRQNRESIADLQATIVKAEQEKNEVILTTKHQVHELETKLETESRVKEELLRCISGAPFDDAFLNERLSAPQRQHLARFLRAQQPKR